jgi:organic hydroperoxide reductase OsmC/OhrA
MGTDEIPSGQNARDSQADGSAPRRSGEPPPESSVQTFAVSAVWTGDARGSGRVRVAEGAIAIPIAGSVDLGGAGGAANPEELLLAALGACFLNTWAIFLAKLQIPYAEPALRVTGTLGRDPAGGFRMTGAVIHALVPESPAAADRAKLEKSLQLAEKYCIISKVARAAIPVTVKIETV